MIRTGANARFCSDCRVLRRAVEKRATAERELKTNPERARERQRRYYERNKPAIRERMGRFNEDPTRRLSKRMTSMIAFALRGAKAWRSWKSMVDYSVDDLKRHIERQFQKGMTWENMGQWHIDHIVPLREFSFSTPEDPDFRAAWALTNLRPLWRSENCAKGGRRLFLL